MDRSSFKRLDDLKDQMIILLGAPYLQKKFAYNSGRYLALIPKRKKANGIITEPYGLKPFSIRRGGGGVVFSDWYPVSKYLLAAQLNPLLLINQLILGKKTNKKKLNYS